MSEKVRDILEQEREIFNRLTTPSVSALNKETLENKIALAVQDAVKEERKRCAEIARAYYGGSKIADEIMEEPICKK